MQKLIKEIILKVKILSKWIIIFSIFFSNISYSNEKFSDVCTFYSSTLEKDKKKCIYKCNIKLRFLLINKKNALVLDIRSQNEFDEGKINQARYTGPDLDSCKREISKADGRPIILVCQNGTNSARMASDLKKEEINVFVLKGGINNWISEKLPLVS